MIYLSKIFVTNTDITQQEKIYLCKIINRLTNFIYFSYLTKKNHIL